MPEPKRYRKKAIEVEAVQWDGSFESRMRIAEWIGGLPAGDPLAPGVRLPPFESGDWLVADGLDRVIDVCDAETFETTYEPAPAPLQEDGGLDDLERWMVDYEGEEGGPVETKLSWITGPDGDPTTRRPAVGDYLVRLADVRRLLAFTQPVLDVELLRKKLLGEEGYRAVLDNWPAAHLPHKVRLDEFDGLDDPKLKAACAEAEGLNQDAADEILRAILDVLASDLETQPASPSEEGPVPGVPETGWTCGGSRNWTDEGSDPEAPTGGKCPGCPDCQPASPSPVEEGDELWKLVDYFENTASGIVTANGGKPWEGCKVGETPASEAWWQAARTLRGFIAARATSEQEAGEVEG